MPSIAPHASHELLLAGRCSRMFPVVLDCHQHRKLSKRPPGRGAVPFALFQTAPPEPTLTLTGHQRARSARHRRAAYAVRNGMHQRGLGQANLNIHGANSSGTSLSLEGTAAACGRERAAATNRAVEDVYLPWTAVAAAVSIGVDGTCTSVRTQQRGSRLVGLCAVGDSVLSDVNDHMHSSDALPRRCHHPPSPIQAANSSILHR